MASGAPSTPFNTPTSYPNPPVPTVLSTGSLCVDLYQSTSSASNSRVVKGFQTALCWDGVESTWGLRSPLSCLTFSTTSNVPVVQYSDAYGCAIGKTIATSINSLTTSPTLNSWCCPSGFTLTMMSCLSTLTQQFYASTSSICGNENLLATGNGARHAHIKGVQTASYGRMSQYKRGFLDLLDRLHDHGEDEHATRHVDDDDDDDGDGDGDNGDNNANPGHGNDESHAPQLSPTISVTRYPAEYLITVFAEATLLIEMPDPTTAPVPSSTGRPSPLDSSPDSPSYETKVMVGCIVTAALLLLLVCLFVWLHKRKRKRKRKDSPNEPGVAASEEEAGKKREFGRSRINNVSDIRSTSLLLESQREREREPEADPEPTAALRDSHDDCVYIQQPGLEMIIREGRDSGMAVRQRAPLRSASASLSTGSSSLAHSSPAELDAVFTMIRTQIPSARASSTVLPWMPGTQDHPENAFVGSDLIEDNEDIVKA